MNVLEVLLDHRWILKSENRDLYYKVRDALPSAQKFITEKLGCSVIENSLLVKLEKIPSVPDSCMGIEAFTSREEYAYLCLVLMFLEELDAEAQFILSQLTEYLSSNMPGGGIDWTSYTCRRRLIRVLRFAADQGMIRITDGKDDSFMEGSNGEVLYENTGASRYFMRNFTRDISEFQNPSDFGKSEFYDMEEDRGFIRRQRVYRRLLFSPGMYRGKDAEEDFDYLKYYGRRLQEDLEKTFDCRVDIHKGSAFFLCGESCRMGRQLPGSTAAGDILLLCCGRIQEKVKLGKWKAAADESLTVSRMELEQLIRSVRTDFGAGFTKGFRELTETEYTEAILQEMQRWTVAKELPDGQFRIYPSAGKIRGAYPEDYNGGIKE